MTWLALAAKWHLLSTAGQWLDSPATPAIVLYLLRRDRHR